MSLVPAPSPDDPLNELVAECLERLEQHGWSSVTTFCSEHPAHADAIRKRLGALAEMGLLPSVGENAPPDFPERLGEFKLLQRLGGGGMGVVFLAVQEHLNRPVALKVIRPEHLYFPGARERFRREVETVAKLEHPGIVQVFTVGEENGLPFFAMERVSGASLAELLHDLRDRMKEGRADRLTGKDLLEVLRARVKDAAADAFVPDADVFARGWVESCFRIIRQVALALEHAHARGVLHRDVKPSNLMLTPDGRVRVLDFGLATTSGASRLTRTGTQLGSLPYMAPEQLNAAEVDRRTDVYALGVVLFEMLALKPPHEGETAEVLMRSILSGAPEALRQLNPTVTRDAETVCFTAIDKDPARRYATAAEFAADLGNVVELRPIQARRAGTLLRIRRFAQRHPAASLALVLAFLLVVGGPTVFAIWQHRVTLREAALHARAEENFRRALGAVDQMLVDVGDNLLTDVPQMERVRKKLLERARDFFKSLHPEEASDPAARREAAGAYERLGKILEDLGDRKAAREALGATIALCYDLGDEVWKDPELARRSIRARLTLARVDQLEAKLPAAETGLTGVVRDVDRMVAVTGDPTFAFDDRVRAQYQLGQVLWASNRLDAAETAFRAAIDAVDRLPSASGAALYLAAAQAWNDLGLMLMGQGNEAGPRAADAEAAFEKADEIGEKFIGDAATPNDRSFFSTVHMNLAGLYRRTDRLDDAEREYRIALPIQEELHQQFPESVLFALEVAHCHDNIAVLFDTRRQFADAAREYQSAVDSLVELNERSPGIAEVEKNLAVGWMNLAMMARKGGSGDGEEAARLATAAGFGDRAFAKNRSDPDLPRLVRTLHYSRCEVLIHALRLAEAADEAETYAHVTPDDWLWAMNAATKLAAIVDLASQDEETPEAERVERARAFAMRGIALLREGVKLGFDRGAESLRRKRDLEPLRAYPEFETVIADLAARPASAPASAPSDGH